jgi:hypothetical protein
MNPQGQKQNIDIKTTTPFTSEDGNQLLVEGVVMRKISRFLTGQTEDGIIPIPVFYDPKTFKIAIDLLPKDLREEYVKYNQDLDKKKK